MSVLSTLRNQKVLGKLKAQEAQEVITRFLADLREGESFPVLGACALLSGGVFLFLALPSAWQTGLILFAAGTSVIVICVFRWAQGVIIEKGMLGFLPEKTQISILSFANSTLLDIMEKSRKNSAKMGEIVAAIILPLSSEERSEAERVLDPEVVRTLRQPLFQLLPTSTQTLLLPRGPPVFTPYARHPPSRSIPMKSSITDSNYYEDEDDEKYHSEDEKTFLIEETTPGGSQSWRNSTKTPLRTSSNTSPTKSFSSSKSQQKRKTSIESNTSSKRPISLFGVTFSKKPVFGYLMDNKMAQQSLMMVKYLLNKKVAHIKNLHLRIVQLVSTLVLAILLWRKRWARRMLISSGKVSFFIGMVITALLSTGVIKLRAGR